MKSIILFILALSVTAICFAQSNYTDTLTITTYYPAPYGVYSNLKLNPSNVPTVGVSRGVMFFNNSSDSIQYYNSTGWQNLTGGGGLDKLTNQTMVCNTVNEAAIRYNSTAKNVEFCDGSSWQTINSTSSNVQYPPGSIVEYAGSSCPGNTIIVDRFYDAQLFVTCYSMQGFPQSRPTIPGGWSSSSPVSMSFGCSIGTCLCGDGCSCESWGVCRCTKTKVSRVKCQY